MQSRPPGIYKRHYLEDLVSRYCGNMSEVTVPGLTIFSSVTQLILTCIIKICLSGVWLKEKKRNQMSEEKMSGAHTRGGRKY